MKCPVCGVERMNILDHYFRYHYIKDMRSIDGMFWRDLIIYAFECKAQHISWDYFLRRVRRDIEWSYGEKITDYQWWRLHKIYYGWGL